MTSHGCGHRLDNKKNSQDLVPDYSNSQHLMKLGGDTVDLESLELFSSFPSSIGGKKNVI